ncbi:hypothetical protein NDU88_002584 [Pleurodeles waltl]|uniref:Uncharacterized protein n=1 Tax=Pleurodeles waltl TaxID=8319 RepID=A0AAV7REY5_PLEWA|nr:hypothetical protein NDU88_002584 [Pleurodeles waltl]
MHPEHPEHLELFILLWGGIDLDESNGLTRPRAVHDQRLPLTYSVTLLVVKCLPLIRMATPDDLQLFPPEQNDGPCITAVQAGCTTGRAKSAFLQKANIMVLGSQEGQCANTPNLVLHAPDV